MRGFTLGKILGFQIDIDWSWLLIFALIVYTLSVGFFPSAYPQFTASTNWILGVVAALLLFASVLAHELTHSVVARRNGIEMKGITLFLFGGAAQTKGEPKTAWVEFKMAIVGPISSLIIAAVFLGLQNLSAAVGWPTPVTAVFGYLWFINLILAVFNMVPGFPLDGGRVLRSAIWGATGNLRKATRWASYVGQGFGYLLMASGFFFVFGGAFVGGIWFILIGWFLAGAARQSYEQLLLQQALSGVDVREVMTGEVPVVAPEMSVEEFVNEHLLRQDYQAYPVSQDHRLLGIIGVEDVRAVPRERWNTTSVEHILRPVEDERTVEPGDDAWKAFMQLAELDAKRLLVMEGDRLEGVVTRENLFHLVRMKTQLEV
jgi:Zn-dependent protease/CBS domain-containing protein